MKSIFSDKMYKIENGNGEWGKEQKTAQGHQILVFYLSERPIFLTRHC